eukprot:6735248-Pyramimonas_sp.AAC.1
MLARLRFARLQAVFLGRFLARADLLSRAQNAPAARGDVVLVQIPSHLELEGAIGRGLKPG